MAGIPPFTTSIDTSVVGPLKDAGQRQLRESWLFLTFCEIHGNDSVEVSSLFNELPL